MRPIALFGLTFFILAVLVGTAFLSGSPEFAIPVALVALLLVLFFAGQRFLAWQALRKHDNDVAATMSDAGDPIPATGVIPDDSSELGDTRETHSEISPRDFPKGSPERAEAERMAALEGGTTSGQADPSRREGRVGDQPGKREGYPADEPASAPRGRS